MATKRQSLDETERRYHAMMDIDKDFRRYVRVPLWMLRHVMERQKERDDRERERNYVAHVQRDVEEIMRRIRQKQRVSCDSSRDGTTDKEQRVSCDSSPDGAIDGEPSYDAMECRETIGLDIGLDDSDLAIMESPPRSVEDQTLVLIAADATEQQIIEIKLTIEQLRAVGITEEEIRLVLRG